MFSYFVLNSSDFHKINHLIKAKDKTFEIAICSKSFFFSREQMFLLSNHAFNFISKHHKCFEIMPPSKIRFIGNENLLFHFSQLVSLFVDIESIQISSDNVLIFHFIGKTLHNSSLLAVCKRVSSFEPQLFSLKSDCLCFIPYYKYHSTKTLTIQFQDKKIQLNPIFVNLISRKIFCLVQENQNTEFIDFSEFESSNVLESIFHLLDGMGFCLDDFDTSIILKAITFLQFDSLSKCIPQNPSEETSPLDYYAYHLFSQSKDFFLSYSLDDICQILSSSFLHLVNETQLFEMISQIVEGDKTKLFLMKFVHWGIASKNHLDDFIEKIQINDISLELFNSMKNCFEFCFFISSDNDFCELLDK
jgi:hypothetical protein